MSDAKSAPSLGEVVVAPADTLAEVEVKAWVNAQVEAEVQRLREQGARCIVVPVNNMSIFRVRCPPALLLLVVSRRCYVFLC